MAVHFRNRQDARTVRLQNEIAWIASRMYPVGIPPPFREWVARPGVRALINRYRAKVHELRAHRLNLRFGPRRRRWIRVSSVSRSPRQLPRTPRVPLPSGVYRDRRFTFGYRFS